MSRLPVATRRFLHAPTIDPKVVLIDGLKLAQLMIEFNVGVSRSQVYEIKRIDSDYFADE